ncbi:MAG: hypothetical protein HKN25_10750 [Pyrinomonadaceae bacterium]|nr:hypothetical protein [Pyrinomonadaceae bacterium]
MKRLTLIGVFLLVAMVKVSFGCFLVVKPLEKFDLSEFVFIGTVIGYVENDKADGVIVRIKEEVYLAEHSKLDFEVYPFGLSADCSTFGLTKYTLSKAYPINTEVRVIAKKSKELLQENGQRLRLDILPGSRGSIVKNYDKKQRRMTSRNSVFDYRSFKTNYGDSKAKRSLREFELRKDLLRLSNAANQQQRTAILERLFFYAISCCGNQLGFYPVYETYSANKIQFEGFRDRFEKLTLSEDNYKMLKAIRYVSQKLQDLGYEEKEIEKAIGDVVEEGGEITKEALLKKSIETLRKIIK